MGFIVGFSLFLVGFIAALVGNDVGSYPLVVFASGLSVFGLGTIAGFFMGLALE